jgi:hypothetical protein
MYSTLRCQGVLKPLPLKMLNIARESAIAIT